MPGAERPTRDPGHHAEQRNPGERDQQQRGKHQRDIQLIAGLQDLIGQPGIGPASAGDKLRYHRANQRQPAGNTQRAEEIGQRRGDTQSHQRLPAAGVIEAEIAQQAGETLRSPWVVLEMMGKTAIRVAHTTSERVASFTQMIISGAMATIGVTCKNTM